MSYITPTILPEILLPVSVTEGFHTADYSSQFIVLDLLAGLSAVFDTVDGSHPLETLSSLAFQNTTHTFLIYLQLHYPPILSQPPKDS